jgi:hypothetical protein
LRWSTGGYYREVEIMTTGQIVLLVFMFLFIIALGGGSDDDDLAG